MVGELRERKTNQEYAAKFAIYDKDNDGYVTADDIKLVTDELGIDITADELDDLIKKADDNEDGMIDYKEYVKMMRHKENYLSE